MSDTAFAIAFELARPSRKRISGGSAKAIGKSKHKHYANATSSAIACDVVMQTDSSLESALVDCRCDGGKAAGQNAGEFLGMAVCTSRGGASDMASALRCDIGQSAVRPMPVQVAVYEYSGQHCPVGWDRYKGTIAPLLQHIERSLSEVERSLLQRFMSS